jgi:hypothetical protein
MDNFKLLKFELKNGIEDEIHKMFIKMTDSEVADYVLDMACDYLKTKGLNYETNVMEILSECCCAGNFIKKDGHCSATRMFNVIEIIMKRLKTVSGDGGIVGIETIEEDKPFS